MPPIVLIATSIRPSFATSAAAAPRPFSCMPFGRDDALGVAEGRRASDRRQDAHGFRIGDEVRHRDRARGEHRSGVPEFAKSTHVAPQPANPVPSAGIEARPNVCERARRGLHDRRRTARCASWSRRGRGGRRT